jgi:hypothetical protein
VELGEGQAAARAAFAEKVKGKPLTQQTCATCIEAIKRNMEEADAQSSLVVCASPPAIPKLA